MFCEYGVKEIHKLNCIGRGTDTRIVQTLRTLQTSSMPVQLLNSIPLMRCKHIRKNYFWNSSFFLYDTRRDWHGSITNVDWDNKVLWDLDSWQERSLPSMNFFLLTARKLLSFVLRKQNVISASSSSVFRTLSTFSPPFMSNSHPRHCFCSFSTSLHNEGHSTRQK